MKYIYGKNAVNNALANNNVSEIYLIDNLKEYRNCKTPVNFITKAEMTKMTKTDKHQGVVAIINSYDTITLDKLIKDASNSEYPLLVILDGLKDPHNLGAIMRSTDAVNAQGIIYKKHNSVSLNATVAKVSCGAIDAVSVCEVTNIVQTINKLKKEGYWIVGSAIGSKDDYRSIDYKRPIALIVGSEGEGISRIVSENCDYLVNLPMKGQVNSLNASVACGILLYEIDSNRYPHNK